MEDGLPITIHIPGVHSNAIWPHERTSYHPRFRQRLPHKILRAVLHCVPRQHSHLQQQPPSTQRRWTQSAHRAPKQRRPPLTQQMRVPNKNNNEPGTNHLPVRHQHGPCKIQSRTRMEYRQKCPGCASFPEIRQFLPLIHPGIFKGSQPTHTTHQKRSQLQRVN